jgi:hypothetical protein
MIQKRADLRGLLRIDSRPGDDGTRRLTAVHRSFQQPQGLVHQLEAQIVCASDQLTTPRSCRITSSVHCPTPDHLWTSQTLTRRIRYAEGHMDLRRNDGPEHKRPLPAGPFTGSFCLFDAICRLAPDRQDDLQFHLLDEMDKPKADHRLRLRERLTIAFGDTERPADCYQQLGSGQLPMIYYVDRASRRCLLVISGQRCYVLDTQAEARLTEELSSYQQRAEQWLK